jgi:hypothetical protein
MRATLSAFFGLIVFSSATMANPPITNISVTCNWGKLTMEAITENDFDQGPHSSDPSGDGHGPGTADEPRKGLANVVYQGDLQALCEFIESEL